MAYVRYFDNRYGDVYEIYLDDNDGEFQMAMRSTGGIGRDPIYYDSLSDIPPFHRNQIEHLIWKRQHPNSQQ